MAGVKRQKSKKDQKSEISEIGKVPSGIKKPLPEPASVQHVFLMLALHLCRKVVFLEPKIKITIYLVALVCGSLVCDFTPVPRSFFSRKTNFLNYYFVKWGWGWTLVTVGVFLGLSAYVYCCGDMKKVRSHFYRLLVGTLMWFCWTKFFVLLELYTASCMNEKFSTRTSCLKNGFAWKGFDISGHSFLLIYCTLLIAEEAKSIRGWEGIGDLLRNKEYDEDSPLKPLSELELKHLQENYYTFTPYVRFAFILLTLLSILWDLMLIATIMYFHSMVQKVVGGMIAMMIWFLCYHLWYKSDFSPGLPGQGSFKYFEVSTPIVKQKYSRYYS